MKVLYGIGTVSGRAEGEVVYYEKNGLMWESITGEKVDSIKGEVEYFNRAAAEVTAFLSILSEKALHTAGKAISLLFESYIVMAQEMGEEIKENITDKGISAEEAVVQVNNRLTERMEELEDDYIRARTADIKGIAEYLLSALWHIKRGEGTKESIKQQGIWFADTFTPGEVLEFGKTHAFAFVTAQDMSHTHTAVTAAACGVPFVSGISYQPDWKNCFVKLDAGYGLLKIYGLR